MKFKVIILLTMLLLANGILFSQDTTGTVKKEKKFEIEFSIGLAKMNPESIYARSLGIDALIDQYARYYQLDQSVTGEFMENKRFIPLNVSGNFLLNDNVYLKLGLDYCFSSASSEKTYQVAWEDFNENHDYNLTDKISYLMPHLGVGLRHASFDFYGALGLGLVRFIHTEELNYSEPGYGLETSDTFEVKGTAPGIIIGIKYRVKLNKKTSGSSVNAFVKLESVLLKVNSLKGSKVSAAADSAGERYSQMLEGTLYNFGWSPYGTQRFDFWDLYETPPTDPLIQNIEKLSLNLSGIRLMIGISF